MIPGQTILSYNDAQEMFSKFPNKIHVVGNAKSLLDKKLGAEIDSQFTVRFNWPDFRKHSASLGTRINIAFFKIFGEYTIQEYNTITAGIAFSFR